MSQMQLDTAKTQVLVAIFPERNDSLIIQVPIAFCVQELECYLVQEYQRAFPGRALHPKTFRILKRFVTDDTENSQAHIFPNYSGTSLCLVDVAKNVQISCIFEHMERIFVVENKDQAADDGRKPLSEKTRKRSVSETSTNASVAAVPPKKRKVKEPKAAPVIETKEAEKKVSKKAMETSESSTQVAEAKPIAEVKKKKKVSSKEVNKSESAAETNVTEPISAVVKKKTAPAKKVKKIAKTAPIPKVIAIQPKSPAQSTSESTTPVANTTMKRSFKDRLDAAKKRVAQDKQDAGEPAHVPEAQSPASSTESASSDEEATIPAAQPKPESSSSEEDSDEEYSQSLLADLTKHNEQSIHRPKFQSQSQPSKTSRSPSIGSVLTPTVFKSSFSLEDVQVKPLRPLGKKSISR